MFIDFLVTKHGLAEVLRSDDTAFQTLHAYFIDRLVPACAQLLEATAAAGEIRPGQDGLRTTEQPDDRISDLFGLAKRKSGASLDADVVVIAGPLAVRNRQLAAVSSAPRVSDNWQVTVDYSCLMTAAAGGRLRADAARNVERILRAAREVYAESLAKSKLDAKLSRR
jgi:hypothetical protein